jgi:hypothetical protein
VVKKALDAVAGQLACPERRLPVRTANGRRRKAPRVGERSISSRRSGVARPYRHASLASSRGAAASSSSHVTPDREEAGTRDKRCPKAIGVGAKSPSRAIVVGSVEARCPRPLTLRTSGGWPRSKGDFRSSTAVVPATPQWLGMFERSPIVLVETSTCRNRRSARGLEDVREQRADKGLVEVFERR